MLANNGRKIMSLNFFSKNNFSRLSRKLQWNKSSAFSVGTTKFFHSSRYLLSEEEKFKGYHDQYDEFLRNIQENFNKPEKYKEGFRNLMKECGKFYEEQKEDFMFNKRCFDPYDRHGITEIVFKFECQDDLNDFVVSTDSSFNQGYSSASLKITSSKTAMFQGSICTEIPKGQNIDFTGFANLMTRRKWKSFRRDSYYDWQLYTHLVLKIRGDGRTWTALIATPESYGETYGDKFTHPLYTRGGPYWQVTRIPFSHFVFSRNNVIDDANPRTLPLHRVAKIGFTLDDAYDGPFHLEIDYIGVQYDKLHNPTNPYETYYIQRYQNFY